MLCRFDREGVKPWSLAEVSFENEVFVHQNLGTYFGQDGAQKAMCLAQGKPWEGGETFDDFC